MARAGGHRLKAQGVSLPLGAIPRLGEDQDIGLASCERGSVAAVSEILISSHIEAATCAASISRLSRCGEARHHRRMSWHHIPKDDAWKQAHLAMLVSSPSAPGCTATIAGTAS